MGSITTGFSMSLDGYVAGPNDDETYIFKWYSMGSIETTMKAGDHDIETKISEQSAEMLESAMQTNGVLLAGRHLFDITDGWGGKHPINLPVVVVTHHVPQAWIDRHPDAPFTFVTDGIESALAKSREIAGDKDIVIASTTIVQQVHKLGLLDYIHIDLVPVFLGQGVRLFEHLDQPLELERLDSVDAPGVTHMNFRVIRT